MDLQLTDEQRLLAESVGELIRRDVVDDGLVPPEADTRLWEALVDFGAFDVASGSVGAIELALIARLVGERLAVVPLVSTGAFYYAVPYDFVSDQPLTVALCLSEPDRRYAPSSPATSVEEGLVFGEKTAVTLADRVDVLAVPASSSDGVVLALVRASEPSVTITAHTILDPTLHSGRVHLDRAQPGWIFGDGAGAALIERTAAAAAVLASAEAIGAAARALSLARDYAAQRRQFGKPIGSFQAIRHLLADMVVKVESSWSSVLYAAAALDEGEPASLETAAVAKAWTSRATLEVAQSALQVFGGIAFTAEHPAHRFLRRIASLGGQYGSASDHERRLGLILAGHLEVVT